MFLFDSGSHRTDEEEYLYVPYSVFEVVKVELPANADTHQPCVITILAAADNLAAPEDLPLAPWY